VKLPVGVWVAVNMGGIKQTIKTRKQVRRLKKGLRAAEKRINAKILKRMFQLMNDESFIKEVEYLLGDVDDYPDFITKERERLREICNSTSGKKK
jgi:hypothetical protein